MKRRLLSVLRYPLRRFHRFMLVNVLHTDDPPHQLALGAAIGVFVAMTPTFGVQMGLVVLLAWLLRANKMVGLPIVWVTNPATFVPIYYSCYYLGRRMLSQPGIGRDWWAELQGTHSMSLYWRKFLEVAAPLWLGCLVMAAALSYVAYWVIYFTVRQYRLKRWGSLTPPEQEAGLAVLKMEDPDFSDAT